MIIEVYDSNLEQKDISSNGYDVCRGLLVVDNKICVVKTSKYQVYALPGGHLEQGESKEECTSREFLEETGIIVNVKEYKVSIHEYFNDLTVRTHYYLCEYVGDGSKDLTDLETEIGLEVIWVSLEEYLELLEKPNTLHKHSLNIHNREFLAIINSM